MTDEVDMGFDAVLAGEKWVAPDEPRAAPVTVAVTEEPELAPAGLTEEGKNAAKALVALPATLTTVDLAKLAREIAMDIKERHVILKEYGLAQQQYDYLETNNEFFKNALSAACIEWQSPLSTVERIKLASAAILEDSLPNLGARMQNKGEGLPGVVEAAKLFQKLSGVGEREAGSANASERFVINIDLGGDQKITVSTTPPQEAPPEFGGHFSLSTDGQTNEGRVQIQSLPEGTGSS